MAKGLCELRGRQCAKRRWNPKSKTTNSPDVQPIAYPLIHLHILALNVECLHGKMNSLKELALALSFLVRNLRWNIRMTSISRLNPCGFAFKQRHIQRMPFFSASYASSPAHAAVGIHRNCDVGNMARAIALNAAHFLVEEAFGVHADPGGMLV